MHRAAAVVLLIALLPAMPRAQAPAAPQAPPATEPQRQVFVEQDARVTRQRLQELLLQLPPAVGEVLRRDPTLANPEYLAPYPTLVSFLQQHPEIARNPSYFFTGPGVFVMTEPADRPYQMFRQIIDGFGFLIIFGALLGSFIWLVRSIVEQRRWLRVSRTQAEAHTKLLDRLTNNEDLLTYIQTPAGRRFLESGPLMAETEPSKPIGAAPLSRIIMSLQAGVVLTSLGIGFWIAQTRFPEDMGEGFFIIGTLAAALGVGFAVSAGLAYLISSRFGLVAPPATATHE